MTIAQTTTQDDETHGAGRGLHAGAERALPLMSLVIPVYKNAGNIPSLLEALGQLHQELAGQLEVVFVVDGSPDDCHLQLSQRLPAASFASRLLLLSRNFGSFAACRAGFEVANGERFAVMAADLQEPPSLIVEFDRALRTGEYDVAVGQRVARRDPLSARLFATFFWGMYRRFIQPDIPPGGVDIFACTRQVRDQLLNLAESNSSLLGLLFWVGFRRIAIPYERREREIGVSAWTVAKKLRYLMDSVFGFSDLPIRVLMGIGALGLIASVTLSVLVLIAKLSDAIPIPGYAATVLTVVFFGALNCFGIGIIGSYMWRTFENTKQRPNFIVASQRIYAGKQEVQG